jgi:hypothetical protein
MAENARREDGKKLGISFIKSPFFAILENP